jgi:CRP/FNR family transcriptional regulator, cyclic AMP receptor protein
MKEIPLIEKAFFLKKTEIFSELDLDLLLAIADKAEVRICDDNELIFCLNQDAHRLYLILDGKVKIEDLDGKRISVLKVRDFFGDESLFNQEPRGYSAFAVGKTILLTISRTHLSELILECPQVAFSIIRAYAAVTSFRKRKMEDLPL